MVLFVGDSVKILHKHCLQFHVGVKWPQEILKKTVLMQNFGGLTNKQYYGMLWYFLEWSIAELD